MKKIILFTFILGLGLASAKFNYAQTGPAGVGNQDGTSSQPRNIIWVDAQQIDVSNGEDVSSWADLSGNGHDMTAGRSPSYTTNIAGINNKNVVRFENSDNEYLTFYSNFYDGTDGVVGNNYTFFWVAARTSADNQQYVFGGSRGNTNRNLYSGWGYPGTAAEPELCSNQWGNNLAADWGDYETDGINEFGIVSSYLDQDDEGRVLYENGTSIASNSATNTLRNGNNQYLGWRTSTGYADVDIAEIIFYQTDINAAQRIIVENYLSAKYNIALDANDYYSNSSYIDDLIGIGTTDGTIKHTATSGSGGALYLEEDNSSLNAANEFLMAAHNGEMHGVTNSDVAPAGYGRFKRIWRIEKTGAIDAIIKFDLVEAGFDAPTDVNDHVLLYRAGTSGNFTEVTASEAINGDNIEYTVSNVNLASGYYTLGLPESRDWYTLISGDWDNDEIWTLDPAGILPNNPSNLTPTTSPSAKYDNVHILSGKPVTVSSNNKNNASIEVEGDLILGTTSGHSFTSIRGSGRIIMEADNFPSGDATHFISKGMGEGTAVFEGNSYLISSEREFFNMEVNLDNTANTVTLTNDLTINKDLSIQNGEFQINNNSTDVLNVFVDNNVTISANGKILVGSGDTYSAHSQYHQFIIQGDFTNNGRAEFTNRVAANYTQNDGTGAVEVIFNNSVEDQTVQCNGVTIFNQLTCNKGNDDTYILDVRASAAANFKLYGRNNQAMTGDNEIGGDRDGNKALRLLAGTLKLGNNIVIDNLSEDNPYDIDSDARLWLYSNASVNYGGTSGSTYPAIYGVLQFSDNCTFTEETNFGTILRAQGTIKIEGGTLNLNSLRTSTWGSAGDHVGAYIQSGGHVYVNNESADDEYASFHLPWQTNIFQMSGGTIEINDQQNGGDGDDFAFIVNSSDANSSVTGGTVIIDAAQNVAGSYLINSRAPIWNLILRNSDGTQWPIEIEPYFASTNNSETINPAQPLRVLNDLTIEAENDAVDPQFVTNNTDVYIGRNFSIQEGAEYVYGTNTTTFNGTENGELYIGYSTADGYEQRFYNFVVDKPADKSLTVTGDTEKTAQYQEDNGNSNWWARLVHIDNALTIEGGTLNQGEYSIRLFGPTTVKATGQCGVYEPGTTHPWALIMLKDADLDISTEKGAIFGNVKMNPAPNTDIIKFTSDVYIKRIAYFHGRINLQTYNLKLDYLHDRATLTDQNYDIDDGSAATEMFFNSGNASDGGLSLKITGNGTYPFPLGVTGKYTPVEVIVTDYADDGYITMRPIDKELSTTVLGSGDILSYYWRVEHSDFGTLPTVQYEFNYNVADDDNGSDHTFYPGKVLDENPFTRSYENDLTKVDDDSDNGYHTITFNGAGAGFGLEKASYTAGVAARFVGAVEVFYTKMLDDAAQTNWEDGTLWTFAPNDIDGNGTVDSYEYHDSRQPNAGDWPQAGDIAIVGWVPFGDPNYDDGEPHGVEVDNSVEFAELRFTQMLDALGNPTERVYAYNFQFRPTVCINPGGSLDGDIIQGEGMFWCRSTGGNKVDPDFSTIDIGNFVSEDSAYFVYESTSNAFVYNNIPSTVPNLLISGNGWGAQDRDFEISTDVEIRQDFELLGDVNLMLSSGANGDITVGNNLRIFESDANGNVSGGNGEIAYPGNTSRTIEVEGDLKLINQSAIIHVESPNTTVVEGNLIVHGDIIQDNTSGGGLQLATASNQDYIKLTLEGEGDHSYTVSSGDDATFYNIEMNKGTDQNSSFTFNNDFDLLGPTSGAGVEKALVMENGTLILDHAGIDINLSTGDDDFEIPGTSCLEVRQGEANVSGSNSGIALDGKLLISGGTVDMDDAVGNGNNYIEYSGSGNAAIEISSGSLTVGSQIRRGLFSDDGVLDYSQSGGTVIVGKNAAPEGNRGVFEVLNAGSSFTHTAGDLYISNAQTSATTAALYLDPDFRDIADGTTITIGGSGTQSSQEIGIYSTINLKNIEIDNSEGEDPAAKIWTIPLSLDETLTINTGTTFDANGIALNIAGDMTNDGTFEANTNTTTFNGNANQAIDGSSSTTFYNLSKSTSTTLTLANDATVDNVFDMDGGTLDDGDNTLTVLGDINFGGTHIWGGTSDGIYLNGAIEQIMSGNGTYGKLAIDNGNGVSISPAAGASIAVTDELELINGVLDIDKYLLSLAINAEITSPAAFSETNMVQTNMNFTDKGIQKTFPAISSTTDFTYPIGCQGKYTPFVLSIDEINSGGSIRLAAANEMQSTIIDDTDECDDFDDTQNALQYHWILRANGVNDFDADTYFKYYDEDALTDNVFGYDTSDYIPAKIKTYGDNTWNKYGPEDFWGGDLKIKFKFENADDNEISGEYTAGIEQPSGPGCSGGAIPSIVSQYISTGDGDWETVATWDTYPVSGGDIPAGGPRGSIVIIDENDEVTVPNNYISVYKTEIRSGGTLNIGTTFGHRLGIVSGTGTLYAERGELPAADYTEFFSSSGGTLEYGGFIQYDILPSITEVKNLTISGGSYTRFPNNDVTINGDFTIDGKLVIFYRPRTTFIKEILLFSVEDSEQVIMILGERSCFLRRYRPDFTGSIHNPPSESMGDLTVNKSSGDLIINGNIFMKGATGWAYLKQRDCKYE